MHGLIGRMLAADGKREELMAVMLAGIGPMPGCLSYVIARDPASDNGIWITEVWSDSSAHQASLDLPHVKETIAKARPMIAGFAERFETEPEGGIGLG
ncbi:antibiotic biosynthesis monooxygenase [Devosia soli]|uniref:Antibiotic biosynthesis monooxygenase n=1 Tax=Devosia soli TaxID=361041 RepID=A0A0F5LCP1_9HYPH|nr:putative quinol monooxygenase [Devosia soli]KKB79974.1 antibiotic biosynthesis monooxygenase [Devosia soli]